MAEIDLDQDKLPRPRCSARNFRQFLHQWPYRVPNLTAANRPGTAFQFKGSVIDRFDRPFENPSVAGVSQFAIRPTVGRSRQTCQNHVAWGHMAQL